MAVKKRAIRDDQKLVRFNKILSIALKLFRKKPYQDISMDQIAARSGLAKGTLYLYFGSKEALFLELRGREYESWFDKIDEGLKKLPREGRDSERIDSLASLIVRSFRDRKLMIRLIVSLHHVLERNIDAETVVNLNRRIAKRLLKTGALLEDRLSFLAPGQGVPLLMQIKALVIGLEQVTEPVPEVRKRFDSCDPEMEIFQMDFSSELSRALTLLLRGLSSHP